MELIAKLPRRHKKILCIITIQMTQIQTFQRPEENRIGEGPHSLGVASLDSEVVDGVQVEVHDLVGEPVAADGFHNPVINGSILVQSIEEDVS